MLKKKIIWNRIFERLLNEQKDCTFPHINLKKITDIGLLLSSLPNYNFFQLIQIKFKDEVNSQKNYPWWSKKYEIKKYKNKKRKKKTIAREKS